MRKFRAKISETGLDDFGASGITFAVQSLKEGQIYNEHMTYVDAWDGHGGKKRVPSGYVIDDNGCWREIGSQSFKKCFEEVTEEKKVASETPAKPGESEIM